MVPDAGTSNDERPAVVLLHSGVADSRMWEVQRRALEGRYAVWAPDLRGFGDRPHQPGPFSHADDVLALLDQHGVEKAALVGSSFGGRVALETASMAPHRVSTLVLLCAAAPLLPPTEDVEAFGEEEDRLLEAGDRHGAVELNVRTWLGPSADESARELVRVMQTRAFDLDAAAEQLSPPVGPQRPEIDLAALTMPALVVSGDRDLLWFRQTAQHLAQRLPHAEAVALEWAGHLPSLERPGETAALVSDYLDRVRARPAR
jgi:pimeloyl-ACP methyl ester carboxylesterase